MHGTGTPNNDESETAAMKRLFGDNMPEVSSTKSSTGHTTSASGAIETVICVLAINNNFTPVNVNWKNRMENLNITDNAKILHISNFKRFMNEKSDPNPKKVNMNKYKI